MSQTASTKAFVAQVFNLLYRGFSIRWRSDLSSPQGLPAASRPEVGDTADWKSALQPDYESGPAPESFLMGRRSGITVP
jgi:hypothetical protein